MLARSARGGCGRRGPAPLLSAGFLNLGLAQLFVAQRAARFAESHIFAHPACVLPSLHLQAQARARTLPRKLPGVSANKDVEKSNARPSTKRHQEGEQVGRNERTGRLMSGFCAYSLAKPMERAAKNRLLPK